MAGGESCFPALKFAFQKFNSPITISFAAAQN